MKVAIWTESVTYALSTDSRMGRLFLNIVQSNSFRNLCKRKTRVGRQFRIAAAALSISANHNAIYSFDILAIYYLVNIHCLQ